MTDEPQLEDKLQSELRELLNRHSAESRSNTPDFVLAEYLIHCLRAFDYAVRYRASVHELDQKAPQTASGPRQGDERAEMDALSRCSPGTLTNALRPPRCPMATDLTPAIEAVLYKPGDPWPPQFQPGRVLKASAVNEFIAERIRAAYPHIRRAVLLEAADEIEAANCYGEFGVIAWLRARAEAGADG